MLFAVTEVIKNISSILTFEGLGGIQPPIVSIDIELITNILNETLSVASPTEFNQNHYMTSFDALQTSNKVNLLAANGRDRTVRR